MDLPQIGEQIDTERALALCAHFGFHALVDRIEQDPLRYKSWVFDGASMLPDAWVSRWFKMPHLRLIALRHDLQYAYGEPGDRQARRLADKALEQALLEDGASKAVAKVFYLAVRAFGDGPVKTRFSWAFALR